MDQGRNGSWAATIATLAVFEMLGAGPLMSWPAAGQSSQTEASQEAHRSGPTPPSNMQRPMPQRLDPGELAKELSSNVKPTIVCVSSRELYESGHIPGAVFHGPASSPKDLKDFQKWAQSLSKTTNIVLYCGCCPAKECPNIRPALMALRQMGFTHVQVLWLDQDFKTDWAAKGYPVQKGK